MLKYKYLKYQHKRNESSCKIQQRTNVKYDIKGSCEEVKVLDLTPMNAPLQAVLAEEQDGTRNTITEVDVIVCSHERKQSFKLLKLHDKDDLSYYSYNGGNG
ncbi:hypothetical protein SK128_007393 [Halocaridina rubra]|uniref:Uncharacterized protein n=1 Tax=Halocaridina rubra TaxID=373956 RepID=A0AAN8WM86_HALRR